MSPEQVRGIVYDILVAIAAIAIPVTLTCIGAAWILMKKLVSDPLVSMGSKMESMNERLFGLEATNNGRMMMQELKTKNLERSTAVLWNRVKTLEQIPKEG